VTINEVKPFVMPLDIERRWEIDDSVLAYWVYWTPYGDECMVMRLHRNGLVEGGDSDWMAFLELERLNPVMYKHNLGSSDFEAEEVLLVDKVHNRFYFAPRDITVEQVMQIVQLTGK